MDRSSNTESEDGLFSTDSPLSNDGDNLNGLAIVLKKGPWTSAEDSILVDYVKKHGEGNWNAVQKHSGLSRCGKSCRLRWANHLRPNLRKGAFTPEEERLIIEFHAKMGNKWSRIAAHLPGRTDNEIKNYWNTRIKRRQRAGLSLYPPDMPLHAHPENQQQLISLGIYGDNRCHDIMQSNGYRTPDDMLDSFDILPYAPEFHGISGSVSKGNIFSTPNSYSFVSQTKFAQEPGETMEDHVRGCPKEALPFERALLDGCINKMPQSLGLHFPYILDHTKKPLPFGANQDSYHLSNVIFSASKPVAGAQKLELPSLQCQQTSFGLWNPSPESMDPIVHSTPLSLSGSFFSSHCPSRGSSCLLEDLLYDAKALSNQSSDRTTSSNYDHGGSYALKACSTEVKDRLDPGSQLACELKSEMLNGNSILDAGRENVEHNLECCRPDAILGSYGGWIGKNVKQPSCHMATEATLEGGNISANRGLRSSCSWNNTPTVCQVSGITSVLPNF